MMMNRKGTEQYYWWSISPRAWIMMIRLAAGGKKGHVRLAWWGVGGGSHHFQWCNMNEWGSRMGDYAPAFSHVWWVARFLLFPVFSSKSDFTGYWLLMILALQKIPYRSIDEPEVLPFIFSNPCPIKNHFPSLSDLNLLCYLGHSG